MVLILFKLDLNVIWGTSGLGLSPSPSRIHLKPYDHRFVHHMHMDIVNKVSLWFWVPQHMTIMFVRVGFWIHFMKQLYSHMLTLVGYLFTNVNSTLFLFCTWSHGDLVTVVLAVRGWRRPNRPTV